MTTGLTIAGSDSSGGAGIQADLKTMTALGVFGMSAITALTAQNTLGVKSIMEVTPQFLHDQLEAVYQDIPPDAVKIGMVASPQLIDIIWQILSRYGPDKIVVDPVMVATSGAKLLADGAIESLTNRLFPLASLVTPNIPEAEILSGQPISSRRQMEQAARQIGEAYGCALLCKGGHTIHDASDVLYHGGEIIWFEGKRINNGNTHGTGCTLSSAIAAYLAKGYGLAEAIKAAKDYISGALAAMLNLGQGKGPLNHMWNIEGDNQ